MILRPRGDQIHNDYNKTLVNSMHSDQLTKIKRRRPFRHVAFYIVLFIAVVGSSLSSGQSGVTISGEWYLTYQDEYIDGKPVTSQFLLKRGYITTRKSINDRFSGRLTTDITVDREGDGLGDIESRLKYCYIKTELPSKRLFQDAWIEFGLVHTPWLDFEQHIDDYRILGSMFLDDFNISSSADYGIIWVSLLGHEMPDSRYFLPGQYGSIAIGIFNGGGYHALENNRNKTVEGRISLRPFPARIPGMQVSYFGKAGTGNTSDAPNLVAHSGTVTWETPSFIGVGTVYTGEGNYKGTAVNLSGESLELQGGSLFGEWVPGQWRWGLVGRFDYLENPGGEAKNIDQRTIAGIVYHFYDKSKVVLNINIHDQWEDGHIQQTVLGEINVEVGF